jgi:undecaprenyl-diphosphatase
MSLWQAAVLGAIQGLTEFLPISSSAHLYVVPTLLGWPYAGVAFDVALHWGTLLALVAAFWKEWVSLLRSPLSADPEVRVAGRLMLGKLVIATIPAAVAGLLLEGPAENLLRSLPLQATMLAVFGFLLWWVDRVRPAGITTGADPLRLPGWFTCILVGCAQALALVPGVSRSGITLTAGRAMAVPRVEAARLAFLLATPITFGAGLLELRKLPPDLPFAALGVGVATAALTGFIAIRGLLRWLGRAGFEVFFVYRVAFALAIVVFMIRH